MSPLILGLLLIGLLIGGVAGLGLLAMVIWAVTLLYRRHWRRLCWALGAIVALAIALGGSGLGLLVSLGWGLGSQLQSRGRLADLEHPGQILSWVKAQLRQLQAPESATAMELQHMFQIATGLKLPASAQPLAGTSVTTFPLATYYLVLPYSPEFQALLDQYFKAVPRQDVVAALTLDPSWRANFVPFWPGTLPWGDRFYIHFLADLPAQSDSPGFATNVLIDQANQRVYLVANQTR
jgi:hypothetical protein